MKHILKPLEDRQVEYVSQIRQYPVVGQCLIVSLKHTVSSENWTNEIEGYLVNAIMPDGSIHK